MELYKKQFELPPMYIIINSDNLKYLKAELVERKLEPAGTKPGIMQYQGLRIITTSDIRQGFFDVVGNL